MTQIVIQMQFSYHLKSAKVLENQFAKASAKLSITVAIPESRGVTAVHGFESEGELQTWVSQNKLVAAFSHIQKKATELQKLMDLDQSFAMKRHQVLQRRIGEDLQALSQQLQLKMDDIALLQKAAEGNDINPAPLKSVVLNEHPNFLGASVFEPTGLPIPDLAWLNFANRASSLRLTSGIVVAYDRSWWRGPRFYGIASNGPLQIPNLASIAWDNKFESLLHF